MEDMEQYLQPTEFLDFHKPRVKEIALKITKDLKTDKEKAVALFYFVRDKIRYNAFSYLPQIKANLKASVTILSPTISSCLIVEKSKNETLIKSTVFTTLHSSQTE